MSRPLLRTLQGDRTALAPSPDIDEVLHQLVGILTMPDLTVAQREDACRLLDSVPHLRRRAQAIKRTCALAETAMERFHATGALGTSTTNPPTAARSSDARPSADLRAVFVDFPYHRNYEELVSTERSIIQQVRTSNRVAFCGAGPLPLTGLIWHRETGDEVTLLEIDAEAAGLARAVVERLMELGLIQRDGIRVELGDAGHAPLAGFDVVIVASLVPLPTVRSIAEGIVCSTTRPLLAVRSAVGLTARLAYDRVRPETITATGLRHVGTIAPDSATTHRPTDSSIALGPGGSSLLGTAPTGVLNTTELFV